MRQWTDYKRANLSYTMYKGRDRLFEEEIKQGIFDDPEKSFDDLLDRLEQEERRVEEGEKLLNRGKRQGPKEYIVKLRKMQSRLDTLMNFIQKKVD